jgi:hypothetical protein
MAIKVKQRHDEILIPALPLPELDVHHPALEPVLRRQRLPLRAVLPEIGARLRRWLGPWRRPDAFEPEPRADDGPPLAPGGRGGRVGDVEGAVRCLQRVQRGVDAEARHDVLRAVVGQDSPRFGRPREGALGAGAGDGRVEREVDGERLRKAVGVVVGDVADLDGGVGVLEFGVDFEEHTSP